MIEISTIPAASLDMINNCENDQRNVVENLIDFDDGHKPGSNSQGTRLTIHSGKASTKTLSIFDDLLPELWCDRIYQYAVKKNKPWGVYITTEDVNNVSLIAEDLWEEGGDPNIEKAIGLLTTRALIFGRGLQMIGDDKSHIHGTVVWCLCSGLNNSVEYHIDYAELYRYETNIIHPPLYAGTCHVSPLSDCEIIGGAFQANMGGIDHYRKFGYKGRLVPKSELADDLIKSPDWVTIKYKRNRGILHDGDLPHLSTPIEHINSSKLRVILGFNCFSSTVGSCCLRAPEHSDAFNRTIKLYQTLASLGLPLTTSDDMSMQVANVTKMTSSDEAGNTHDSSLSNGSIKYTAKDISKRNPALARLLVLAAKKVKANQRPNENI